MNELALEDFLTACVFIMPVVWFLTDPRKLQDRLNLKDILFTIAQLSFIVLNLYSTRYFPIPKTPYDWLIQIPGIFLFLFGMYIAIWAKLTMKSSWGTPAGHDLKRQSKLITSGPFSLSRNPIYLGVIMMFFGLTLASLSWFIFLVPLIAWRFYQATLKEEQLLKVYFGKTYLEYYKNTPRFI